MTPAAKYLRLSRDREGNELGVTRQREDADMLIAQRGWDAVYEFVDNDISAAGKKRRPAFEKLLAAIDRGEVSAIVAWSLDRLTRNRRDTVRLIEACQPHNITIALCRGSDMDLSTPAGRLSADILASVARHEIEQKSDRQRRSQQQRAEKGMRAGGRKPFGYEQDGMTLIPAEADAIRRAYADVLAGTPLAQIAREWNAAGLYSGQERWSQPRPRQLAKWSHDTVRAVLANPRYAGLRAFSGEIVGEAAWPAIVDEETFHALTALLRDPTRRAGGSGREGRQLLTGVALCGVCGATVHAGRGNAGARGYRMYRCSGSTGHVARKLEPIDAYVSDLVVERLTRDDARDLLVDAGRPDVDALRARAQMLRGRIDDLAAEYAADEDGVLTASQLRTATAGLQAKLSAVETEMADAGRVDVLGPLVHAESVADGWAAMDTARRRAVVGVLMTVRILPVGRGARTFRPETVGIDWRV